MKKLIVSALSLMLIGAAIAPSAVAAKKPVKTVLYMHGVNPTGEQDGVDWLANATPPMSMDTTEPAAGNPKTMSYSWPVFNSQCSGLPLAFPTWVGTVNGTIVGDATLKVNFASAPGTVTARIWADTAVFSCNEAYVEPAQEIEVTVPAGANEVEAVFKGLKLKAGMSIMVEILTNGVVPGRVLYDSADYPTSLTFKCIPESGNKCA
ncbi:MAG: hypothetical protein QOG54_390 [Actinomycetota bacterium]|jgi:hypothetical protein|nr:hypothetical protein [Actinomycetota bacterium]